MSSSKEEAQHYRVMFSENRAVMLLIDPHDGTIRDASAGACRYYGYPLAELTAMKISQINILPSAEVAAAMRRARGQEKNHFFFQHRLASGEVRDVEVYSHPITLDGEEYLYSVIHDNTQRKQVEESLRRSEEKYHLAIEATCDGLWDWDIATGHVEYSPAWSRIIGERDVANDYTVWESRIHPDDKERIQESLRLHLAGETEVWREEHRLSNAEGGWTWVLGRGRVVARDGEGRPLRMVGTMTDISERKRVEEKLAYLASHDSLTELYNRKELDRRLSDELLRAARYSHDISLFMLDLDYFKRVNDRYGHQVGDTVLHGIARVVQQTIRKTDFAGRYGGEEFVIILPETPLAEAEELAERLRQNIENTPFGVAEGKALHITASIGVATYPEHGETIEELIRSADGAMYEAKAVGRNRIHVAPPPR